MRLEGVYVEELGRSLWMRPGTSDEGGLKALETNYHVPPAEMPVPEKVLDLGANIGVTAAHYQLLWPRALIWMVEPNPDNLALARRNAARAIPLEMAVGKESGWRRLREEGLSADAYTLAEEGRRVHVIALQHLLNVIGPMNFCKMDIEGTEWEVLDQLDGIEHLLVEFHDEPRDYPSILKRGLAALKQRGWSARHHPPHPASVFATR